MTSILNTTPRKLQAARRSGAQSRRESIFLVNGSVTIAPDSKCDRVEVIPSKTKQSNTRRIRDCRTLGQILDDQMFAAATNAIELDLYLSWMARLPRYGAKVITRPIIWTRKYLELPAAVEELTPMTLAQEIEQLIDSGKQWQSGETVWLGERVFVKRDSHDSISLNVKVNTPAKPFKPPVAYGKIAFLSFKEGRGWTLRDDWKRTVAKAEKLVGLPI